MIGTIRKHSTWLWLVIIAATIVSFVIFFTPTSPMGGGRGGPTTIGSMDGRPIMTEDYLEARREARLGFFLRSQGAFPEDVNAAQYGFDLERETRSRLVLLAQLEELKVEVDDKSVADWIVRNFASPDQPGTAKANYAQMLETLGKRGISAQQFSDYIRHEIGVAHMVSVVGVAGELVTPREAARLYRQQNERIEAEAVVLESTNFLAQVQITPEAIEEFFSLRQSAYRTPERVQVDYVRFAASNYIAQAEQELGRITNLTERLDVLYQQQGANAFLDTNGQVMPPEVAKLKIREEERDKVALVVARREAAKFGGELINMEPVAAANLAKLVGEKGMTVETTAPFTETGIAPIPGASPSLAEVAFKLNAERPISSSLVGQKDVHIIALKQRIPSEVPPLDEVRIRVNEDFRREESRKLAQAAGTNLVVMLKSVVNETNDFASAVIASGNPLTRLPKFSQASRNVTGWPRQAPMGSVLSAVKDLQPGEISDFIQTATGGFVVHLRSREAVGEEELKDTLPEQLSELQANGRYAAFRDWLSHRVDESRLSFFSDSQATEEAGAGGETEVP